jgi:hypothetical protein
MDKLITKWVPVENENWRAVVSDPFKKQAWIGCTASGEVWEVNTHSQHSRKICQLPEGMLADKLTIVVSPKRTYIAIAQTFGSFGVVLERQTGNVIYKLNRGDYGNAIDNSMFSVAFLLHGDREVVVHATNWNRLDATSLPDLIPLTERGDVDDQYFQAMLTVSPDYRYIISNGWVWHPFGAMKSWDATAWITTSPTLAEDAKGELPYSEYLWDRPIAFVDDRTFIVWGGEPIGDRMDHDSAICFHDVVTGEEKNSFPVPFDGELGIFDDSIYLMNKDNGTIVYDARTFSPLKQLPDCRPLAFHSESGEMLEVNNDQWIITTIN